MPATPADPIALAEAVRGGDRRALARAITLVESTRRDHRDRARALLAALAPYAGRSLRVGISGVPGVGKSTFIEAFGVHAIDQGRRVAVLTVDPSSALSGGSILGDKTRMPRLAAERRAFVRPSPSGGSLGGVARRTRESILVCEAAGHDLVVVETVGVGQSEVAVAGMTDLFLLLLLPGGGDELQGIKRGIMELADVLLVNKADGELERTATTTAAEYRGALGFLRPRDADWTAVVATCSAATGAGIASAFDLVRRFETEMTARGAITRRRAAQARDWMWAEVADALTVRLRAHPRAAALLTELEPAVARGDLPGSVAAEQVVDAFLGEPTGTASAPGTRGPQSPPTTRRCR
ncbi:MAG: methylmalonyl Co-A mutase-associated GTPase MeaB [Ectothiorhodospiraceae bacterium]|nr:methylmalonyl Co-A mutase-associated GTPase MeaB [Ectothiorhodospiraceae bacterium]